jgi:hypothetical protein
MSGAAPAGVPPDLQPPAVATLGMRREGAGIPGMVGGSDVVARGGAHGQRWVGSEPEMEIHGTVARYFGKSFTETMVVCAMEKKDRASVTSCTKVSR